MNWIWLLAYVAIGFFVAVLWQIYIGRQEEQRDDGLNALTAAVVLCVWPVFLFAGVVAGLGWIVTHAADWISPEQGGEG